MHSSPSCPLRYYESQLRVPARCRQAPLTSASAVLDLEAGEVRVVLDEFVNRRLDFDEPGWNSAIE